MSIPRLENLIGQLVWNEGAAAGMKNWAFGMPRSQHQRWSAGGKPRNEHRIVGEYELHVSCDWVLNTNSGSLSSTEYFQRGRPELDDEHYCSIEHPLVFETFRVPIFCVDFVLSQSSLKFEWSNGATFEAIYSDASYDEGADGEQWRLYRPGATHPPASGDRPGEEILASHLVMMLVDGNYKFVVE